MVLINGISALVTGHVRGLASFLLFLSVLHVRVKQEGGPLNHQNLRQHSGLGCEASGTAGNEHLLLKPFGLWCFVIAAQTKADKVLGFGEGKSGE